MVFDLDGTLLSDKSSWRKAHEFFGTEHRGDVGLARYEKREIDYVEFMDHDIGAWPKGISRSVFDFILDDYELNPGAEQMIDGLKRRSIKTAIISSGLDILADAVSARLGIDFHVANGIEFDTKGRSTGRGVPRVDPYRKGLVLEEILRRAGVSDLETMGVADTRFDAGILQMCGHRVAFRPKAVDAAELGKVAHYFIDDLRELLPIVEWINSPEKQR